MSQDQKPAGPPMPPMWILVILAVVTAILSKTGRGDLVWPVITVGAIVCGILFAAAKKKQDRQVVSVAVTASVRRRATGEVGENGASVAAVGGEWGGKLGEAWGQVYILHFTAGHGVRADFSLSGRRARLGSDICLRHPTRAEMSIVKTGPHASH